MTKQVSITCSEMTFVYTTRHATYGPQFNSLSHLES